MTYRPGARLHRRASERADTYNLSSGLNLDMVLKQVVVGYERLSRAPIPWQLNRWFRRPYVKGAAVWNWNQPNLH